MIPNADKGRRYPRHPDDGSCDCVHYRNRNHYDPIDWRHIWRRLLRATTYRRERVVTLPRLWRRIPLVSGA